MPRLNKFIAQALGVSRREADDLIVSGVITVNDQPAKLGRQVTDEDKVRAKDKQLTLADFRYVIFNKPIKYVCSRKRQGDSPTVYSILPEYLQHLKPVGRLDKHSSGLLLLTNDGDFAHSMTHPRFHKEKVYQVHLDKHLSGDDLAAINAGVQLEDGTSRLMCRPVAESSRKGTLTYQINMHEGRNRQIRRTFAALGYRVEKLHRTALANYSLATYPLKPGEWREISPQL